MVFKGTDAVEGNGIYYAISSNDHPVTTLMVKNSIASSSSTNNIGLTISEVCINFRVNGYLTDSK